MGQQDFIPRNIYAIKKLSDEFEEICTEYAQIQNTGIEATSTNTKNHLLIRDFQNRVMEVLLGLSDIAIKRSPELSPKQAEQQFEKVLSRYKRRFLGNERNEYTFDDLLGRVSHIVVGLLVYGEKQLPFRIYPAKNTTDIASDVSGEKVESTSEFFRIAPKFAIFAQICLKKGIELDSLIHYSEELEVSQFRKSPYRICYISTPFGVRTICISDQIGEMTYVYSGFVDISFFKTVQKGKRVEEFLVKGITYSSEYGNTLEETVFSSWGENSLQSNLQLSELIQFQNQLVSHEDELVNSGIVCMHGIWYFSDVGGANKWPKIGSKHLSNFPSRKWNMDNKIGGETGSISHGDELKKMFAALGLRVATEQEEKQRWADILLSYETELLESGMYKQDCVWYFGSAKGVTQWPKNVNGRRLQSFPNSIFLRENKIGGKYPIISSISELKKMFAALGLRVATEQEEKQRWASILVSHTKELYEIGIEKIDDIWFFGDAKGIDNWPKIQDGGQNKKLLHFPNIVFNQENGIGNTIGVLTHPAELKKMFAALGLKVSTDEQEKTRWANILVSHADKLAEGGIMLEDDIWFFGDAKGLKKQKMIHGKYIGSYPRTFFNLKNNIGNHEGMLLSVHHVAQMFAMLGLRVATESEEKGRWKRILLNHAEVFQRMGVSIQGEFWDFSHMVSNGSWEKIHGGSLSNFPNATYNRLLGIGNFKGELLNKKDVARMAESLGIQVRILG